MNSLDEADKQSLFPNRQVQPLYLGMVEYKPHYVLAKASIGQIMISFKNTLNVKPKNEYEENLYSVIIPEIKSLLQQYEEILQVKTYYEMVVVYYNLLVKLPEKTIVYNEEHGRTKMKNPKIGFLIKASKQRLHFIITRETPNIYKDNAELSTEFEKLRRQCRLLYDNIAKFEKTFAVAVRKSKVILEQPIAQVMTQIIN